MKPIRQYIKKIIEIPVKMMQAYDEAMAQMGEYERAMIIQMQKEPICPEELYQSSVMIQQAGVLEKCAKEEQEGIEAVIS